MSMAEARAVLGPDVAAQVQAHAASLPPLRPEQIVEVAALLRPAWLALQARDAAARAAEAA